MSQARTFLETLFANKPKKLFILIWTLQGDRKRSRWFHDVQKAAAYVDPLSGCNIYVGVGLSPSDFGEFKRCESDNVAGVVGFAADIDLKSEAHPKGSRPETVEQALSILPPELPPSIVIETGNGIQCWWLFNEPWIFNEAAERQQAAAIFSRWQTLLKYACQRNGWAFERLKDLARVLRVPGTLNVKDPANPKETRVREFHDHRYNPSEFRTYLDEHSIPSEDDVLRHAQELAPSISDQSLSISLSAAIPEDHLAQWMEQDPRFGATWNHQRDDMADTSQSGYDLALANFGFRKRLNEQEIIDLIIHNRRMHGARQSTRLDYFQRTLSKAWKSVGDQSIPANAINGSNNGSASVAASDDESPDPRSKVDPYAKAKLCDELSFILGVQITRIKKLKGSEPVYLVEVENGTVEFSDIAKLMSAKHVREALAARVDKIIPKFKPAQWDRIVQMMLDACINTEGTDDLESKGVARIYIGKYLAEIPPLSSSDELAPDDYRPVVDLGKITISSTDLQLHVNRTTSQNLSVKRMATLISLLGGESVRVHRGGIDQSRWALPVTEFSPGDYRQGHGEDDDPE